MAGHRPNLRQIAQVAAVAVVAVTAAAVPLRPAAADDDGWGHRRWHGDGGWNGNAGVYFYSGPRYYYAPPPPAYYAPPPVYYAPPPVYYGPPTLGFSINVPLRH